METLFDDAPAPAQELLPRDGSAVLHANFLSRDDSTEVFEELLRATPWEQRQITVYGRRVMQPRLVAWHGDAGRSYRYSGDELSPVSWTPLLQRLKSSCEEVAGARFNSMLANLYRNGEDGVSWHSDDEPELGPQPVVASLSLGAERRFDLRHRGTGETIKTVLPSGSLLVMSGHCQRHWLHQIAKTKRVTQPRINLTFRNIVDEP